MTERAVIDGFDSWLQRLGEKTARAVLELLEVYRAGQVDEAVFAEALGQMVAAVNSSARAAADVVAARAVETVLGERVTATGSAAVSAVEDHGRLARAAATFAGILADEDVDARLERFARDEPAQAAQQQVVHSYKSHGIDGYTRGLNAGACELCVWLRKEHLRPGGFVYPASKPMHRHTGCRCTPIPTRKEIDNDE
ncbi:Phage head morphogenesis protein, SPP1 gp7 family OS=Tsukamurella paurometabola (strain ATCC 8368/ DSM / CCUG 35730 / CIP 100753 / JCM 10117 / KCTC 9821/ NBRC 16120 / NCIMB 702349 / NCTC 13040) OX=521096 GN=Tpau_3895 PE=4 SV=1 [Tsukamurella paurometabola]|uniref:Phage head morphogenesis protein, SPP1 gp7 family n=1 Tax=Tsukamurella paurometabola (strain ATCC 8368 / DSM 20162 / CCUG 35730 / CIP 100753 / JCM 10117 / KCTC 9821 / NBRC 16120 / NCIMB 702349 / NCTC 13040) TaxID=521096 RepID=D5UMJ3_TSUPD|nr:hypothetical protein [Tsukamurella paurometabola]ADG80467.1 conserved hypothetical protein [Tsukamurella paurometabola DSM 20162]SUP39754.1 Uncharacterised protein [Tsukamurella paurometabola]